MDEENWKQKYLASLDRLEKKEKAWLATEALLKQGLSRVSLAAQGLDTKLDKDLDVLRKTLRSDIDLNHLEEVVNDLTRSVAHLDDQRNDKSVAQSPQELLTQWLDSLSVPASLKSRFKMLRKQINNTQSLTEMEAPLREVAALVNQALEHESQHAGGRGHGGGFFSRMFGGDGDKIAERQAQAVTEGDFAESSTAPQISEFCIQLLDTLSLPMELNDQVESLKDRLGEGLSDRTVAPALTAIADIISTMRRQIEAENKELQTFLHQLGDNLKEIDQDLSGAQDHHKVAKDNSREFDAVVHAHVKDIQTTVDSSSEAGGLKEQIQGRLDAIRRHLDQYRESEETRQLQLEAQLERLNSRVHGMESEGEKLRRRLQEKHEQAVRDPLTGLYNRLAYDERVIQEFARWKRYQQPLVLMVIDVDRFKNVNDTYGHKAGDKALVLIADQLRNHLRESDFLARFGGEEFVVLMPETDLDSAMVAAEKLRVAVEGCQFHYQNAQVNITVSAGLAQLRKDDSTESLFKRADEAMYRAKQAGRNQCLVEASA